MQIYLVYNITYGYIINTLSNARSFEGFNKREKNAAGSLVCKKLTALSVAVRLAAIQFC